MHPYFTHESRLKQEDFYPILHSLRGGKYRVQVYTRLLRKIPEGFGDSPEEALLACEKVLRELLEMPEWRHVA